ncbi:MAG: exo-alpha-sialidase [Armatimonadetes bacterium]|nr:exo-alpha-sialidase [Armatimonadota bacterium]
MGVAVRLGICLTVAVAIAVGLAKGEQSSPGQKRYLARPPLLETGGDPYMRPPLFGTSRPMAVTAGGFTSVQANVDEFGNNIVGDAANEPSIGISPANPNAIVIGWRQFDNVASNFRQAGYGYSSDAGATWTFPGVHDPGVFRSDPVLDSDSEGNIYYNSLFVTGNDWHCDTYISSDGGVTWDGPNFGFGGDKAWFTIDKTGGIGHGNLYAAWSTAGNNFYPNQFSLSTDGGINWMDPMEILPRRQVWGTLTVDLNGDLYVSGQRNGSFYVSKSTDAKFSPGSPTFDFTVTVPLGGPLVFRGGPNPGGLLGQVWIAADTSDGPTSGNVYLLSSIDPSGSDPLDISIARSEDGGLTWSAPTRVNDDPPGTDAWQWFGTMSVAPNGRIDVVWNDTRSMGITSLSETFYSYSLDGGRTWSKNVAMTPLWNSHIGWPNQNKIGDYYDMVSDDTGAGLAYSATFNGEQDVYYIRIDPEPPIMPGSFRLLRGVLVSGGLADLLASDDEHVVARAGLTLFFQEPPLQMIVTGTVATGSPVELGFLLESRLNTPGVTQSIELFNYDSGTWEEVDARPAETVDSITHVLISVDPGRFIEATTLQVRARIIYQQTGLTLLWPWTASIDRANWTILP